jgi:hypothetical protein
MKTKKNTRPLPPTRQAPTRPAPHLPARIRPLRPAAEFLDFCMYPGMKPDMPAVTYPTAV